MLLHDRIDAFLGLALVAVVPLGFAVSRSAPVPARSALVPAVLLALASLALPPGPRAGTLALPWFFLSSWIALRSLRVLLDRGLGDLPALCDLAARGMLPIGAVWLAMARAGVQPLGFSEPIVSLTAVHFHYAAFAGPTMVARTGIFLRGRGTAGWLDTSWRACALGSLFGPPLLAIGFTASPVLESLAACVLALAYGGLALLLCCVVGPRLRGFPAWALGAAGASALVAMPLAAAYGLGPWRGPGGPSIPTMVAVHGSLQGIGFCLGGLLGWWWAGPSLGEPGSGHYLGSPCDSPPPS